MLRIGGKKPHDGAVEDGDGAGNGALEREARDEEDEEEGGVELDAIDPDTQTVGTGAKNYGSDPQGDRKLTA